MMYAWRCGVAVVLGLMWCFTDCAPTTVTQCLWVTGVCVLCYLSTPLLLQNISRESKNVSLENSSTQTEQSLQEDIVDDVQLGFDVPDRKPTTPTTTHIYKYINTVTGTSPECPDLKKSVQQVIECVYTQYLHPWYPADTEPRREQPLYQVLSKESDFIIDRVLCRVTDFNVCKTIVGSVRILKEHIHRAKQSDKEPLFRSRTEEMAVLRKVSEALVRNLLPESLWGQDAIRCALNEIISLKALETVSWLSEPDTLNQLLVTSLDSGDSKQTYALDSDLSVDDNCEDDQISTDCYTGSAVEESKVDVDLEEYLKDNMWRNGRWALSIPHVEWKNSEPVFTVHLEDQDSTEELHWDINKTYMDVICFRNRLQESVTNLPLISELPKSSEETISDGVKEDVRASVELFLQEVVADDQMGHSQPVFQFLCPLELNEEERDLLSGLATLLTAGQQEDELYSSSSCPEPSTLTAEETSEASSDEDCDIADDGICTDSFLGFGRKSKKEKPGLDRPDVSSGLQQTKPKDQGTLQKEDEKHCQKMASLQKNNASEAIMELMKEISGNAVCVNMLTDFVVVPFLTGKVNSFISKLIPTEEKMTKYINDLCERLWPGGSPAPLKPKPTPSSLAKQKKPTNEDMDKTRDKALQLICDSYLSSIFKKKKLERVFKLFQSSSENKKLVYRLLTFLLSEFLPGEDALRDALRKTSK